MKWHPMLFKGDMVRALLDGSKTQTRRIPTCANSLVNGKRVSAKTWKACGFDWAKAWIDNTPNPCFHVTAADERLYRIYPIWSVGDGIWCRETWCEGEEPGEVWWRADPDGEEAHREAGDRPWRPSIHMPRWASRISLSVKEMRCERVGEISDADAYAEGISGGDWRGDPVGEFAKLWDSINKARGYPFKNSPPVYVLGLGKI